MRSLEVDNGTWDDLKTACHVSGMHDRWVGPWSEIVLALGQPFREMEQRYGDRSPGAETEHEEKGKRLNSV